MTITPAIMVDPSPQDKFMLAMHERMVELESLLPPWSGECLSCLHRLQYQADGKRLNFRHDRLGGELAQEVGTLSTWRKTHVQGIGTGGGLT